MTATIFCRSNLFVKILLLAMLLGSCREKEGPDRLIVQQQADAKMDELLRELAKNWRFSNIQAARSSGAKQQPWPAWQNFLRELSQAPTLRIDNFREKAILLTQLSFDAESQLPFSYQKPAMKARMSALRTRVTMLNQYLRLNPLPLKEIKETIQEINNEIGSILSEANEWEVKQRIPMEEGESDMMQMRDTTRAIPSISKSIR